MTIQIIIKIGLSIFLIVWSMLGVWLVMNFHRLFGSHPDDPAETPGARSFGVAHIVAVWIGGMALAIYFISR
jgi:hypothetical protein